MDSNPELRVLLSHEEIGAMVGRIAAEIKREYQGKYPLLVGILKGSFVFLADLVRHLDFPMEVEFIRLASYGRGRSTPGELKVVHNLVTRVRDRDVLVIEDIVDTGHTTKFILDYLRGQKPASLRLCALTNKPSRRQVPVEIDYLGFTIPNKFIVGYGIDWDERFRNLPDICFVEVAENDV